MLRSLSGLYNNFLIKNGYQIDKNTWRLMVQSVKEGSLILLLFLSIRTIFATTIFRNHNNDRECCFFYLI